MPTHANVMNARARRPEVISREPRFYLDKSRRALHRVAAEPTAQEGAHEIVVESNRVVRVQEMNASMRNELASAANEIAIEVAAAEEDADTVAEDDTLLNTSADPPETVVSTDEQKLRQIVVNREDIGAQDHKKLSAATKSRAAPTPMLRC